MTNDKLEHKISILKNALEEIKNHPGLRLTSMERIFTWHTGKQEAHKICARIAQKALKDIDDVK